MEAITQGGVLDTNSVLPQSASTILPESKGYFFTCEIVLFNDTRNNTWYIYQSLTSWLPVRYLLYANFHIFCKARNVLFLFVYLRMLIT